MLRIRLGFCFPTAPALRCWLSSRCNDEQRWKKVTAACHRARLVAGKRSRCACCPKVSCIFRLTMIGIVQQGRPKMFSLCRVAGRMHIRRSRLCPSLLSRVCPPFCHIVSSWSRADSKNREIAQLEQRERSLRASLEEHNAPTLESSGSPTASRHRGRRFVGDEVGLK